MKPRIIKVIDSAKGIAIVWDPKRESSPYAVARFTGLSNKRYIVSSRHKDEADAESVARSLLTLKA